jgi:putative transposase
MVSPAQRRAGVQWAREAYRLPERRACRALGVSLSSVRYRSVKPSREPLRARLRELAGVRVSYGYRRLWILLQREGWGVNHKLVQRLYREEGLTLRRRRPKRRRSAVRRERAAQPTAANEQWAMDFVHDTLSNGRTVRVLTVLDVYSRECVALEAGVGFRAADVARILTDAGIERGKLPSLISVDNGTEFTSRDLDHWAYWNQVRQALAVLASRPTTRSSKRSTAVFGVSASRSTGSSTWPTLRGRSSGGGRSTTTSDRTAV